MGKFCIFVFTLLLLGLCEGGIKKCWFGKPTNEDVSCKNIENAGGCPSDRICVHRMKHNRSWAGCCPAGKGPCHTLSQLLDPETGRTPPKCTKDGFYESKQCMNVEGMLTCMCVDVNGKRTTNTTYDENFVCRPEPSDKCLDCMCGVQSGDSTPSCGINKWWYGDDKCGGSGCVEDRRQCRCGPYLIQKEIYDDCSSRADLPLDTWETCSANDDCARMCLKEFMSENALACTGKTDPKKVTCEDFARMLFGGADGCTKTKTKLFGRAVNRCVKDN